jgi:hypothetical protein
LVCGIQTHPQHFWPVPLALSSLTMLFVLQAPVCSRQFTRTVRGSLPPKPLLLSHVAVVLTEPKREIKAVVPYLLLAYSARLRTAHRRVEMRRPCRSTPPPPRPMAPRGRRSHGCEVELRRSISLARGRQRRVICLPLDGPVLLAPQWLSAAVRRPPLVSLPPPGGNGPSRLFPSSLCGLMVRRWR